MKQKLHNHSTKSIFPKQIGNHVAPFPGKSKSTFFFLSTLLILQFIIAGQSIGGTISGSIFEEAEPERGIGAIWVYVYDLSGTRWATVLSASDGSYSVPGLPAGTYKIEFDARTNTNFVPEWYKEQYDFATATEVSVTDTGETIVDNVFLEVGGSITGLVSVMVDGVPLWNLHDIDVTLYDESFTYVSFTRTDNGTYTFNGVRPGNYKIEVNGTIANYIVEWYNNADNFETASLIQVIAGEETANDRMFLEQGGMIEGEVRSRYPLGDPPNFRRLEGVRIDVYDEDLVWISSTVTDDIGYYYIWALPTGNYYLYYNAREAVPPHVSEWYGGATTSLDADTVSVVAGDVLQEIEIELTPASTVTGRVLIEGTSQGIENVNIIAFEAVGDFIFAGFATTDANGNFSLAELPYGEFKLSISGTYVGYSREWYDDVSTFEEATTINVTGDMSIPDIELFEVNGAISGIVTNVSGVGIPDIPVSASNANNLQTIALGRTDANGEYTFPGIYPGDYKVHFEATGTGYFDEWYNNKPDFFSADIITIEALPLGGINAVLEASTGDFNGDNILTLDDLILGLQVLAGLSPEGLMINGTAGNDGKIGFEEVLHILATLSN